jgi:hypothetical protein
MLHTLDLDLEIDTPSIINMLSIKKMEHVDDISFGEPFGRI